MPPPLTGSKYMYVTADFLFNVAKVLVYVFTRMDQSNIYFSGKSKSSVTKTCYVVFLQCDRKTFNLLLFCYSGLLSELLVPHLRHHGTLHQGCSSY